MRLYVFGVRYPAVYSPYLDDQYHDLLDRGHELTFMADSQFAGRAATPRQMRLIERGRYFDPAAGRAFYSTVVRAAGSFVAHPVARTRQIRRAGLHGGPTALVSRSLRLLNMSLDAPDACIVNGTRTLLRISWLKRAYPDATVCYYYHGGGLHGATAEDVFPKVDLVLTNTSSSRLRLAAMGCPIDRIRVLPVGFNPARYPLTTRPLSPDRPLQLLSAGRISPEKGHVHALRALAGLRARGFRRFHYTIIGSGKAVDVSTVRQCIREHGLEDVVTLAGEQHNDVVVATLAATDILLLPSIAFGSHVETQAAIVQEAMMMRAAIVVSDVGGVAECVPPFWKRWCIDPGDPAAIAAAIVELAHMPPDRMAAEASAAREWTIERYSAGYINDRLLRHLRDFGEAEPEARKPISA